MSRRRFSSAERDALCIACGALCCKDFAIEISAPSCHKDAERIRWYLSHERTRVFIRDDHWYLLVANRCRHLGQDNRCTAHESRPDVCRRHSRKECERGGRVFYDHLFNAPQEFDAYYGRRDMIHR
ncbi:YkgJ family cysteine cluster protein [bacterium]|nr:YkgJ family cysteine cluster protein [bacterium]